jgi:hypothetical protein
MHILTTLFENLHDYGIAILHYEHDTLFLIKKGLRESEI